MYISMVGIDGRNSLREYDTRRRLFPPRLNGMRNTLLGNVVKRLVRREPNSHF